MFGFVFGDGNDFGFVEAVIFVFVGSEVVARGVALRRVGVSAIFAACNGVGVFSPVARRAAQSKHDIDARSGFAAILEVANFDGRRAARAECGQSVFVQRDCVLGFRVVGIIVGSAAVAGFGVRNRRKLFFALFAGFVRRVNLNFVVRVLVGGFAVFILDATVFVVVDESTVFLRGEIADGETDNVVFGARVVKNLLARFLVFDVPVLFDGAARESVSGSRRRFSTSFSNEGRLLEAVVVVDNLVAVLSIGSGFNFGCLDAVVVFGTRLKRGCKCSLCGGECGLCGGKFCFVVACFGHARFCRGDSSCCRGVSFLRVGLRAFFGAFSGEVSHERSLICVGRLVSTDNLSLREESEPVINAVFAVFVGERGVVSTERSFFDDNPFATKVNAVETFVQAAEAEEFRRFLRRVVGDCRSAAAVVVPGIVRIGLVFVAVARFGVAVNRVQRRVVVGCLFCVGSDTVGQTENNFFEVVGFVVVAVEVSVRKLNRGSVFGQSFKSVFRHRGGTDFFVADFVNAELKVGANFVALQSGRAAERQTFDCEAVVTFGRLVGVSRDGRTFGSSRKCAVRTHDELFGRVL